MCLFFFKLDYWRFIRRVLSRISYTVHHLRLFRITETSAMNQCRYPDTEKVLHRVSPMGNLQVTDLKSQPSNKEGEIEKSYQGHRRTLVEGILQTWDRTLIRRKKVVSTLVSSDSVKTRNSEDHIIFISLRFG